MFEIIDQNPQEAVIRVIGVGGCGGNAVEHMIGKGLAGVEFIAANTDAQALKRSTARTQLQLGSGLTRGLGAGARPEIGRDAAMEDRDRIAEVINNPGLVNVDFADVRTVMSELGMAMMGSATGAGSDRARQAAERAVASPLLEEVNLAGARGVLVNITASAGLKMKEYHEVMNTIKAFTAEDAMVIVGTVIDNAMEDQLRVTMIATGLGGAIAKARQPRLEVVVEPALERTGTDGLAPASEPVDYDRLERTPAVIRRGRAPAANSAAAGFDPSDIPAFLRKQAD